MGKGGLVISEMRRVTGASIRIFSKEQIKYISQNEEVVQVTFSVSCERASYPFHFSWAYPNFVSYYSTLVSILGI